MQIMVIDEWCIRIAAVQKVDENEEKAKTQASQ
jgi:hypothetical protein